MNKLINKSTNTNDKDLVELAGYNAYKPYSVGRRLEVNGNDYIVKDTHYNDPSGLDAITVQKDKTNELTIVYVGTDPSKPNGQQDLITDLKLLDDVPPAQLTAANKYYEQMKAKYEKGGYKIKSTCGNSLAGTLVGYIAIKHPEIKGVTLNPAMLPQGVVNPHQEYSNLTN